MKLHYRPEIDGLRAIAVVAVLFFHTNVPGFSGGFVGVDVFFVISGFLITSIILQDIQQGTFSIARFYERRIRRIFPALFPVILFTLVVGAFLFDYQAFKGLGDSVAATTLFASNILFWRETGYFGASSQFKPLLHTWSLAVEEQFYIFFPLLLYFINRFLKSRYLPILLAAAALSFGISVWGLFHDHISPTFYLVPTRAWELLAGSMLALCGLPSPRSKPIREFLSLSGLALIVYSVSFYTEATLFPGHNALAPVLGAVMVISSGGETVLGRALSVKPLVFTGLISYSLYLWHWPLVAFAKYMMFREFHGYESAFIILVSFAASTLSYTYIERPFRGSKSLIPDRKHLFVLAGVVMMLASGVGLVIHVENGMAYRYPEANKIIPELVSDWSSRSLHGEILQASPSVIANPALCGDDKVTPSFVVWGDSHAASLAVCMDEKAKERKLSGYIVTYGSTPPMIGIEGVPIPGIARFNENVLTFIRDRPEIKTVFLAAAWSHYVGGGKGEFRKVSVTGRDGRPRLAILQEGLINTIDALHRSGRKVVFVSDVPTLVSDPVRLMYLTKRFPDVREYSDLLRLISPSLKAYDAENQQLIKVPEMNNITVLHPESLFFEHGGQAQFFTENRLLYSDSNHLSVFGSRYVASVFDEVFREMAALP